MSKICSLPQSEILVCFTDTATGNKKTLSRHTFVDSTTADSSYVFTDENNSEFDISGGTITLGQCLLEGTCEAEGFPIWTLLSKFSDPHPDASTYGADFTYIGNVPSGSTSTHPDGVTGSISGWNVFATCAESQPSTDSNGHDWLSGAPDSFSTVSFNRVNPDPECTQDENVYLTKECYSKRILDAIENQTSALLVEGCIPDPDDGGTQVGVAGVSTTDGSLLWGPIPLSDYGFVSCCAEIKACQGLSGFDYFNINDFTPGDNITWEVSIDGTNVGSVGNDPNSFPATSGKSTWYTDLQALISSQPGWAMTLISDADQLTNDRPRWRIDYTGSSPSTLTINRTSGSSDIINIQVNQDGSVVSTWTDGGVPIGTNQFFDC